MATSSTSSRSTGVIPSSATPWRRRAPFLNEPARSVARGPQPVQPRQQPTRRAGSLPPRGPLRGHPRGNLPARAWHHLAARVSRRCAFIPTATTAPTTTRRSKPGPRSSPPSPIFPATSPASIARGSRGTAAAKAPLAIPAARHGQPPRPRRPLRRRAGRPRGRRGDRDDARAPIH